MATPEPPAPEPKGGTGKFYYPNGATYQGEYKLLIIEPPAPAEPEKKGAKKGKDEPPPPPPEPPKRVRHGTGRYVEGELIYQGEFVDDAITGTGKFTYPSGSYYEGQWIEGQYQGQGKYVWPDGRCYEGSWVDNKMHGRGAFTDASGQRWEGEFHNGSGPGITCDLR